MDATLKNFYDSGKHLLTDTKVPRKMHQKAVKQTTADEAGDPHKVFQKNTINNLPKKAEMLKDVERFIKQAEDLL
jgi:hypothetical protein